eukprot:4962685-Prymnesium_polylepis.1
MAHIYGADAILYMTDDATVERELQLRSVAARTPPFVLVPTPLHCFASPALSVTKVAPHERLALLQLD